LGTQILDKLEAYGALLATVQDLPSAKTAKPKIEKLTGEMRTLTAEVAKLGQVPRSVEEAFYKDKKNQNRADSIMKSMVTSSRKITADQAIFNELKETLTNWERATRNRPETPPTAPKAPTAPPPPPPASK
jgi:outer membrane murein-binding lipoprotein Lpp